MIAGSVFLDEPTEHGADGAIRRSKRRRRGEGPPPTRTSRRVPRWHTPPAVPLPKLLCHLASLVHREGRTVGAVLQTLGPPGTMLMCVILSTPFLVPVSIPGTSIPGGLLIMAVGLGAALGRKPVLPRRVLAFELRGRAWARVLIWNARVARRLGPVVSAGSEGALMRLHGVALVGCACVFVVPLPVPMANALPAWAICALALGLLRRNRLAVAGGYVLAALSFAWLLGAMWLGREGLRALL